MTRELLHGDIRADGNGSLARRAVREVTLARLEIREGRFQRSMAVVTGFSAIVSGFEAYVQHRRGAFSHWPMWTPVALTPPTAVVAGAALVSERAARRVLPVLSAVVLADGVLGFIYHLRGIARMPGGYSLGRYNIVMGPPVFAPLLMCTVGVAGLLTAYLRREVAPDRLSALGARRSATAGEGTASSSEPSHDDAVRPNAPTQSRAPSAECRRSAPTAERSLEERIAHGQFQRIMAATAAVFGVLAGGEAYFEHRRGSFNDPVMWTPVLVTPPMVAAGIGAAVSERIARDVLPWTSAITFVDGLLGFALHLRGIKRMPGGVRNLDFNLTMGPPMFAPLLLCSVGLLGLVAVLLRRKES